MTNTSRLVTLGLTSPWHTMRRLLHLHGQLWSTHVSTTITRTQYSLLTIIHAEPGHDQQTAGTLAALDKNTTANVVARLETGQLLQRTPNPRDRRSKLLTITPEGARVLHELCPRIHAMEATLDETLSPEDRRHLQQLLASFIDEHEPRLPSPPSSP